MAIAASISYQTCPKPFSKEIAIDHAAKSPFVMEPRDKVWWGGTGAGHGQVWWGSTGAGRGQVWWGGTGAGHGQVWWGGTGAGRGQVWWGGTGAGRGQVWWGGTGAGLGFSRVALGQGRAMSGES